MARSRWIVALAAVVAITAGCGGGSGGGGEPPPPPKRNLTINFAGTGTGTVTSSPAGIACSAGPCAAMFDQDTMITLSASPGAGSTFAGWSGGGCGGSGPCTFPMPASDTTITATFALVPPVTHMLTVTVGGTGNGNVSSAPGGINCNAPNSCQNLFTEGASVVLTAAPAGDGSTFAGWGGACTGEVTASCTVSMTGDLTVTASFDPPPPKHTLYVHVTGAGSGSVTSLPGGIDCSSGTCQYDFVENTDVVLTATPAGGGGYVFSGWSGGGCSGTGTCTVTMTANVDVTATFGTIQTVTVNTLGDGVGTVTSVPPGINCTTGSSAGCSAVFPSGTNVSLTATAAAGSGFYGWSPTCDGSLGPCEFPVISSTSLNATFTAWSVRRPFPTDVRGVTALGSTLVAVGSGAFVTSTDGLAWTGHELSSTAKLRAVTADAGGSVAVAVGEAGLVMSSADAATWTQRTSNATSTLNAVVHGGGVYVAAGAGGEIISSANGADWTARTSNTPYELLAVAYGSSTFVAVGYGGTILTSSNGADWAAPASPVTQPLVGVAYDPGSGFVAVGRLGAVVTSPDGGTWTQQAASLPLGASVEVRGVAASAGTFVAIDSSHAIHRSTTGGTSWNSYAEAEDLQGSSVTGIGAAGGAFFALSDYGMSRSPDGLAWTRVLTLGPTPMAMAYGNSTYVLVAHGAILTSPDGATWTSRWAGNPYLRASDMVSSVVYANSTFIAVSGHGILGSTDGASWTQVGPAPSSYGGQVAWGSGKGFVVTSADNSAAAVLTSPDGNTWTPQPTAGITFPLYGITYGNSTFVAVGGSGSGSAIYSNADPAGTAAWIQQSSPTTHVLGGVLWGNSTFVANDSQSGQDSYTSANAINWTGPHGAPSWMGKLIGFGGGLFVTQTFMQSADGQVWALMPWRPSSMTYIYAGTADGPDGWVVTDGRAFAVHP